MSPEYLGRPPTVFPIQGREQRALCVIADRRASIAVIARSWQKAGMTKKRDRSPQEKKALSYANDRRNTYGQNNKAARKLIPLRKAQDSRQDRRKVAQGLSVITKVAEEVADLIESSALHDVHRIGGWKKSSDASLEEVVASAIAARESRSGRKGRSAEAAASPIAEDREAIMLRVKRLRRLARLISRKKPMPSELAKHFDQAADDLEARATTSAVGS